MVLGVVGHNVVELCRVDKLDDTANKVSQVFQQKIVIGADERVPIKLSFAGLRPMRNEVVAPYIWSNACFLRRITKYTNSTRLGELPAFISEIIRCREMMEFSPSHTEEHL